MILFLAACAPHEAAPAAVVSSTAPSVPVVSEEAPPPPVSWRSGWQEGPAVRSQPSQVWAVTLDGPVTEPIVGDGDRFWVVADGIVSAYDAKGGRMWRQPIRATTGPEPGPDGLAVGTETGLKLLEKQTGVMTKDLPTDAPVRGRPLAYVDGVAFTTGRGAVGSTMPWTFSRPLSTAGRLAADGTVVYASTLEGELYAVENGKALWTTSLGAPAAGGPSTDGERVYVPISASGSTPGGVVAIDRQGKERWRWRSRFGPAASVAVDERHVYVADKDGRVYALDPVDGSEAWSAEGYGAFSTAPVLVGNSLYAGNSDGALYRIDLDDGGVAWKVELGAAVTGEPAVVGGLIVVGLANGRLIALGG